MTHAQQVAVGEDPQAASDDRHRAMSISEYVQQEKISEFRVFNVGRQDNHTAPDQHVVLHGRVPGEPVLYTHMFCTCAYATRCGWVPP